MWLFNSSIALVLFITFHGCMNVVALISKDAYNTICALLGSNWYAIAATMGLALLVLVHIVYAFILNFQNRKARGDNKYAVTAKPDKVEWASQNMLVLGIIIVIGLVLHLKDFWYNMMWAEIVGAEGQFSPTDGFEWIKFTFSNPVFVVLYVIWLVAIWFHLTHGIWSSMQTMGLSGHTWFNRWKCIGQIWSTVVMLMFLIVVLGFAFFPDYVGQCDFKLLPFAVD